MLILNNKHLPAKGGDDTMANEFKQLANPKADALLLLSTQVKKIILIVAERVPCPKPKNTLKNTKKEYVRVMVYRITGTAEMKTPP